MSPSKTELRTWVEIDAEAVRRNFRRVAARLTQRGFVIASVKKEAYGHGLLAVARALADEPGLRGVGVATLDEALTLRKPGANLPKDFPILIMAPLRGGELEEAIRIGATLTLTDHDEGIAAARAAAATGKLARGHFKVDTGMGRIGLGPEQAAAAFREYSELDGVAVEAIYSHLADGWGNPASLGSQQEAMARFRSAAGEAAKTLSVHWGGSDALAIAGELAAGDGLRVGISLYGDHPADGFEPAMQFKTRIIYRKRVLAGTPVSYGWTFTTTRETELAVIGAGYGNGVLRALSGKGAVLIDGKRCPILGRVCMDQSIVDVTDLIAEGGKAEVGDEAVVFGRQGEGEIKAREQAEKAGTISYELFCLAGGLNPRK